MTPKEEEKILELYNLYGWTCFICGSPVTQRAHIIGNTKANISKYGKEIIDSVFNWLPACGLPHNALIDIGSASEISDYIAFSIEHKNRHTIEQTVRENIQRKLSKGSL